MVFIIIIRVCVLKIKLSDKTNQRRVAVFLIGKPLINFIRLTARTTKFSEAPSRS